MSAPYTHYLFDLDNTLLDFDRSSREAFAEAIERLDLICTDRMFAQYAEINRRYWKLLEAGEIRSDEMRYRRFADFLTIYGSPADPLEVSKDYLRCLSEKVHWVDGAKEVLDVLKSNGVSLSLITNGLKSVQRPRLERSGLYHYFDLVVISDEIGHAKPQPAYFEYTLQKLNHPPAERVLVVGDNVESDVLGGQLAGLHTCWYNKHGKQRPEGVAAPTYEIKRIRQLLYVREAATFSRTNR